jgi:hypothetical protein
MATVSMQTVHWTNKLKKTMPVQFTLKSEDPENGVTKENVVRAVQYGSDTFKNANIPSDAYAAVFRDTDNGNKIGGLLHAKDTTYAFSSDTRDESKGLYAVAKQIGNQLEVIA